jgi:hypothetical protein
MLAGYAGSANGALHRLLREIEKLRSSAAKSDAARDSHYQCSAVNRVDRPGDPIIIAGAGARVAPA